MKIEKLKPQFCQQPIGSFEVCGEIAGYRISTDDNVVSVSYCDDHALIYVLGKRNLEALKCRSCRASLRPGYLTNSIGNPFCGVDCMILHDGSLYRPAYT